MKYDRMLNKAVKPSESEILKFIGSRADLWKTIHKYVNENYDFKPELVFFTKKYGWTIRYKKSGKTLCYFFPEDDAFSILIILGSKESEKITSALAVVTPAQSEPNKSIVKILFLNISNHPQLICN